MLAQVMEFVKQYGATIALMFTWLGILWVAIRKRREWYRKEFTGQVNFSLSFLFNGVLTNRTLLEQSAIQVWLNDMAVGSVKAAANETKVDQPFIKLDDKEDMAFIYRAVTNVISEKFSEGYMAEVLGVPIKKDVFRFAITYERYEDIRTLKLRVILVSETDLKTMFGEQTGGPAVIIPKPLYQARYQTIKLMNQHYHNTGQKDALPLGRVEIAVKV